MKKVVLYARTASAEQKYDGSGTEAQLSALRKFAKSKKYQVVKEYVDVGSSGNDLLRPSLVQLRKDIPRRKFSAILTKDQIRLSRNVLDSLVLQDWFQKRGIKVEYLTVPNGGSAASQFVSLMLTAIAQRENRMRREKVKKALLAKRSEQKAKTPSLAAKRF